MALLSVEKPCLILNKGWAPINVVLVARAIRLLCLDAARAVDTETYQVYNWAEWSQLKPRQEFIQAVQQRYRIPEVVVLQDYNKVPRSSVTFSRRNVYKRDKYACQFCGIQPGSDELTIDHVVPRAQGGESSWTNCVLACGPCNSRKADRTPEQANMRLRKPPVKPDWQPLYTNPANRLESWKKFISASYWDVELEE